MLATGGKARSSQPESAATRNAHSIDPAWAAVFCLVLAFGAADTDRWGISLDSDPELWLLIRVAMFGPGVLAGLASADVRRVMGRAPLAPLMAAMVVMVVVSPAGLATTSDTLIALGLFGFVSLGAWAVLRFGWSTVMQWSGGTILAFLSTGIAAQFVLDSSPRWQGWAVHANRLGLISALGVAIALGLIGRSRMALPLLVLAIGNLWMTNSRTAMLAAGVAGLIWLGAITRRRVGSVAIGLVALAGLATFASGSAETVSAAASRSGEAEEVVTLTGRVDVWEFTIGEIARRPFTGIGAGSTNLFFAEASAQGVVPFAAGHAHNAVLQAALSGGVPVAFLYALALLSYVAVRQQAVRRPDRDGIVAVVIVVGLMEDLMATPHAVFILLGAALASVAHERGGVSQPSTAVT